MDHECVEAVPRTKRWTDVVGSIGGTAAFDGTYANSRTPPLENVRSRLRVIQRDAGVIAAFQFLLGLILSASSAVAIYKSSPVR
jgi:hypothetical protein